MACYRVSFQNAREFDVTVEPTHVADQLRASVWVAQIYRVVAGTRESQPMSRVDGKPIQIIGVSEQSAMEIAKYVLTDVTGSVVAQVTNCGTTSGTPPLPASVV